MNLSMKWLSDYVTLDTTVKDFCAAMTMSGSKVEVATEEGSEIKNVVVGKLLSVVPHENSDHLVVCQVDVGQETADSNRNRCTKRQGWRHRSGCPLRCRTAERRENQKGQAAWRRKQWDALLPRRTGLDGS